MSTLAVLAIIAATVAFQYFKGRLIRSVATLITIIAASAVAFSYFEVLADVFISRGADSAAGALVGWAMSLCFALIFVIVFAVLQAIVVKIMTVKVDLGLADKVGRSVVGLFIGLLLAGLLLTALNMGLLDQQYPYQRFPSPRTDSANPNRAFLNPDGLVVGWYSAMSAGSMSNNHSFAVVRADFLDQMYLNRMPGWDVGTVVFDSVIRTPVQWHGPESFDTEDGRITPDTGSRFVVARFSFSSRAAGRGDLRFTPSQVRLICKVAGDESVTAGTGQAVFPVGYMRSPNTVQMTSLLDNITLGRDDFEDGSRDIDFVFEVPQNMTAVLGQFKANDVSTIPGPSDEPFEPVFFDHQARQEPQDDINGDQDDQYDDQYYDDDDW